MIRAIRHFFLAMTILVLSGCGFQLRARCLFASLREHLPGHG